MLFFGVRDCPAIAVASLLMNVISAIKIHPDLPLFQFRVPGWHGYYVPGLVGRTASQRVPAFQSLPDRNEEACPRLDPAQAPAELIAAACRVQELWIQHAQAEFAPECLTIYLSNRCNLDCRYCYCADARSADSPVIREKVVLAAAKLVAECCAAKQKVFQLVLHGGGEPTLHFALVRRLVMLTRRIAEDAGIGWRAHIATNGVLPEVDARWLARHFDTVGLSCDGPPEIHNALRSRPGGAGSYDDVERTAHAVIDSGGRLMVRATILPETMDRQVEIVEHLVRRLGASDIRFEPAYRLSGAHNSRFEAGQAADFVSHFLAAEACAARLGAVLAYSGVRIDELHGPYCNVLRDVLHLLPDGSAASCFLRLEGTSADGERAAIGSYDNASGRFILEHEKIRQLRTRAAAIPAQCRDCLCSYHCARACPEVCSVLDGPDSDPAGGFHCWVAQYLSQAWIADAVSQTHPGAACTSANRVESQDLLSERIRLETLLAELPPEVDAEDILNEWRRVRKTFRIESGCLPKPVWAERGFEHDSAAAWEILKGEIRNGSAEDPISVYLHVPFCARRCAFCDCYSVVSGFHRRSLKEKLFTQALHREIEAWAGLPGLRDRRVTTVHFGGGTPNHLDPPLFESILKACRTSFGISDTTEWALESTSRPLDDRHLTWLRELGFTRLHVGVQTLEEPVRRQIGRHDSAQQVVNKLAQAAATGYVVSVDLVYGLPGQTAGGLVMTIRRLADIGVHGFSLYRFQRTHRNRSFWIQDSNPPGDRLFEYVLFQCAEQLLTSAGYRKNHFAHFARSEDADLYYRHAQRGEDLLALGPTADGVFGCYRYRHPKLEGYLAGENGKRPVLEGGLWENDVERRLRVPSASLMAAEIDDRLLNQLKGTGLIEHWQETGFLRMDSEPGRQVLTGNGSWFINEMLNQLKRVIL